VLEFVYEALWIEHIARLPELQHHEPANERLLDRARRIYPKVVNVPRLVALIASADLFGKDFRQRETVDVSGNERQEPEIARSLPVLCLVSRIPRLDTSRQKWMKGM
jgi:hypothetical protein